MKNAIEAAPRRYARAARCGERIRVLRDRQKMTLEELAKRTGFTPANLSKVENGRINTPVETLAKIADALGVPLAQVFIDDQGKPVCDGANVLVVPMLLMHELMDECHGITQSFHSTMRYVAAFEERLAPLRDAIH